MDNPGPRIETVEPDKAKKKIVKRNQSKRALQKQKKYSASGLPKRPTCGHNTKNRKCSTLTSNDLFYFHKNFYKYSDKIVQDNFILQNVIIEPIRRRRPRNNQRNNCRQHTVKYFVTTKKNKKMVPVCIKSFANILRIKPSRIQGVIKRRVSSGTPATENRGGDRKTFSFSSRKEAVENFIKRFQPLESHYSRSQIKTRLYLPSELNIKKMHRMYNDEALPGYDVKIGFFRKIFNTRFNIGFGSPRVDVCSTCLQLLEKLKMENRENENQNLRTKYRIHKLRANAFYKLLNDDNPEVQIISFDCQKNLPLPKLPDQSTYYSRQLYYHNFTIEIGNSHVSLTPENVHAYVWTEDQSSKGSNEICTCVYACLNGLNLDGKTILRLVADGCGGQNKNSMVIGMAMKWLHETRGHNTIKRVEIVFPVTGHSFLPADRVFAFTEKRIKRMECIIQPIEYSNIVAEHATIHNVVKDIPILNWKSVCQNFLKNTQSWHFQISKSKRIILKRVNLEVLVRGELSYRNDHGVYKKLLKRGKHLMDFRTEAVRAVRRLKQEKLDDVDELLKKHYGDVWRTLPVLEYYNAVLQGTQVLGEDEDNLYDNDDTAINNSEEFLMQEVLDFV